MNNIIFYSLNFIFLIVFIIFLYLYLTQDTKDNFNYAPGTQQIDPLTGSPKIYKKKNNFLYYLIAACLLFIISIIMTVVNINNTSKPTKPESSNQDLDL